MKQDKWAISTSTNHRYVDRGWWNAYVLAAVATQTCHGLHRSCPTCRDRHRTTWRVPAFLARSSIAGSLLPPPILPNLPTWCAPFAYATAGSAVIVVASSTASVVSPVVSVTSFLLRIFHWWYELCRTWLGRREQIISHWVDGGLVVKPSTFAEALMKSYNLLSLQLWACYRQFHQQLPTPSSTIVI